MSNLRSDARDWLKKVREGLPRPSAVELETAMIYINYLCRQIDQIEEMMHDQVRARDVMIADFTSDTAEGAGRNLPVVYREHGGVTYAVYGTSSINYVKKLEEQIMDMLRNREKDINERCQQIAVDKTKKAMEDVDKKSGEENRPPGLYCNQRDIKIAEVEDLNHTDVRCPQCGAVYTRR